MRLGPILLAISTFLGGAVQAQLITPKEVPAAVRTPPVVALLLRNNQTPSGFCAVPLSVFDGEKWTSGPLDTERGKNPVTLRDKGVSEKLLKQTFYCPYDASVTFAPASPGRHAAGVDEDGFALKGTLSGNVGKADVGVVVTNRPLSWPAPTKTDTGLDVQRLVPLLENAAVEEIKSAHATVDMRKYETPQVKLALQFDLTRDRRAYWVHLFRALSKQVAPPRENFEPRDFPKWSLDYFAVVEETADKAYSVLWQEACFNCDLMWHYDLRPVGLCDINGDGTAEMVLLHMASEWESSGYNMFALIDGRFQKVETVKVLP